MKYIGILGSTGSIGKSALEVVRKNNKFNKEKIKIVSLSCDKNVELLFKEIIEFKPEIVSVFNKESYKTLCEKVLAYNKINKEKIKSEIYTGMSGLIKVATYEKTSLLLVSVVGMVGLLPTIKAIESKIDIALANKETLVSGGDIVLKKAKENNVRIIPVDSEHSAIFQCLQGEKEKDIKNLIITASGGSFRDFTFEEITNKKAKEALKHPNWAMGNKITIDSATLMNKGFEIIEAHYLFGVEEKNIKTYIHRESIIHSMVEFKDNSIKAQLAVPNMTGPIAYAFNFNDRALAYMDSLNISEIIANSLSNKFTLTFEEIDEKRFPCIKIARDVLNEKGSSLAVLNSANEELVKFYLQDKIKFYQITEIIIEALNSIENINNPNLDEILEADLKGREFVKNYVVNKCF